MSAIQVSSFVKLSGDFPEDAGKCLSNQSANRVGLVTNIIAQFGRRFAQVENDFGGALYDVTHLKSSTPPVPQAQAFPENADLVESIKHKKALKTSMGELEHIIAICEQSLQNIAAEITSQKRKRNAGSSPDMGAVKKIGILNEVEELFTRIHNALRELQQTGYSLRREYNRTERFAINVKVSYSSLVEQIQATMADFDAALVDSKATLQASNLRALNTIYRGGKQTRRNRRNRRGTVRRR